MCLFICGILYYIWYWSTMYCHCFHWYNRAFMFFCKNYFFAFMLVISGVPHSVVEGQFCEELCCKWILCFSFVFAVLGIEPRALCILWTFWGNNQSRWSNASPNSWATSLHFSSNYKRLKIWNKIFLDFLLVVFSPWDEVHLEMEAVFSKILCSELLFMT